MTQPLTLFDKIWAQHEILKAENGLSLLWVDRHYVHEGSFQGFDKVDARGEKVSRPDLTFAIADHYVPTCAQPGLRRSVAEAHGRPARGEHRQARRHADGPERPASGDRACGRSGAGPDHSRSHHRVRRQPHRDARRARLDRDRHRRFGGQPRAADADVLAEEAEPDARDGRRQARSRHRREGHRALDHRQDRHQRRARARRRICRQCDPRPDPGRTPDALQPRDRIRCAHRHGRAGRDDVRLHQGPAVRPEGRGFRSRGRGLASPAERSGCRVRSRGVARCLSVLRRW